MGSARGHREGFTLVEMTVAMLVVVILAVTVTELYRENVRHWRVQDRRGEAMENLRIGLAAVSSELRKATQPPRVDAGGQRIVFQTPRGTVAYYVENGQLRREVGGEGHNPVANHVGSFNLGSVCDEGGQLISLELVADIEGDPPRLMTMLYVPLGPVEVAGEPRTTP
ncbi:MAG: PilW family protein [Bacillota bacterium]